MEQSSGAAIRQCITCVRRGGVISIPGGYLGFLQGFLLGDTFDKGITFKMGQTHMQKIMPMLLECVQKELLYPEVIITHKLSLEQAVHGYTIFDEKKEDCHKVVLIP